jgi:hypothetical protein
MRLYTNRAEKSRAAAETAQEILLPVLLVADLRAFPCFCGLMAGADMSVVNTAFAWFFAAQFAALACAACVCAARAIRRARQPKRYGVISAATIRRVLGR